MKTRRSKYSFALSAH